MGVPSPIIRFPQMEPRSPGQSPPSAGASSLGRASGRSTWLARNVASPKSPQRVLLTKPRLTWPRLCYVGCGDRPCDHPFGWKPRSPTLAGASLILRQCKDWLLVAECYANSVMGFSLPVTQGPPIRTQKPRSRPPRPPGLLLVRTRLHQKPNGRSDGIETAIALFI